MLQQMANRKARGTRGLSPYATIDSRLCVTVPEAAEMLGISRNFAYQLVREGKLPSIRFGKRILIPKVALEKMLEKGVSQ